MIGPAIAFAAIAASVSACSGAAPAAVTNNAKTVTFASVPGCDDTVAVTGLWSVLLEGHGYKAVAKNVDLAAGFSGIARGDIDGCLNAWLPTTHAAFVKYKDDLVILDKPYFANDELGLAVPDFVEENTITELVQSRQQEASCASGQVPPFDLQQLNAHGSLTVTRPKIDDFLIDAEERRWRSDEIFGLVADGKLKVSIGARFPLEHAAEAHAALESRATTGKILLLPATVDGRA
jgi:hypothetical protein